MLPTLRYNNLRSLPSHRTCVTQKLAADGGASSSLRHLRLSHQNDLTASRLGLSPTETREHPSTIPLVIGPPKLERRLQALNGNCHCEALESLLSLTLPLHNAKTRYWLRQLQMLALRRKRVSAAGFPAALLNGVSQNYQRCLRACLGSGIPTSNPTKAVPSSARASGESGGGIPSSKPLNVPVIPSSRGGGTGCRDNPTLRALSPPGNQMKGLEILVGRGLG